MALDDVGRHQIRIRPVAGAARADGAIDAARELRADSPATLVDAALTLYVLGWTCDNGSCTKLWQVLPTSQTGWLAAELNAATPPADLNTPPYHVQVQ